jgi:hypothetical protein
MPFALRRCEKCRFAFEAPATSPTGAPVDNRCRQCGGPTEAVDPIELTAPTQRARPPRESTKTLKVETIQIPPSLLPPR